MKMYHATTKEAWAAILAEGVLWGRKDQYRMGNKLARVNYLATSRYDVHCHRAYRYLPVLLEIDMPEIVVAGYWEYVTYDPIPLSRIRKI